MNILYHYVILPGYGDEDRCRFELEDDRRVNDEVFTAAIHSLFHVLKTWDVFNYGYIELHIRDVYSLADHQFLRCSLPSFNGNKSGGVRWQERTHSNRNRITDLCS